MEVQSRILGCIEVENAAIEIYKPLKNFYPEEKDFWNGLIADEIEHVAVLRANQFMDDYYELQPEDHPPPMELIIKTIAFAHDFIRKMKETPVGLEEALRICLSIEESMAESFVGFLMIEDNSSKEGFEKVLMDERSHVNKIRNFMINKGFIKLS
jgi:rubrerythrin